MIPSSLARPRAAGGATAGTVSSSTVWAHWASFAMPPHSPADLQPEQQASVPLLSADNSGRNYNAGKRGKDAHLAPPAAGSPGVQGTVAWAAPGRSSFLVAGPFGMLFCCLLTHMSVIVSMQCARFKFACRAGCWRLTHRRTGTNPIGRLEGPECLSCTAALHSAKSNFTAKKRKRAHAPR